MIKIWKKMITLKELHTQTFVTWWTNNEWTGQEQTMNGQVKNKQWMDRSKTNNEWTGQVLLVEETRVASDFKHVSDVDQTTKWSWSLKSKDQICLTFLSH